MPELPEVETTVNELSPYMINRQISAVEVLAPKTIEIPSVEEFIKGLTGRRIRKSVPPGQTPDFHSG